eukprot:4209287-Prymnesium_polylepis.2
MSAQPRSPLILPPSLPRAARALTLPRRALSDRSARVRRLVSARRPRALVVPSHRPLPPVSHSMNSPNQIIAQSPSRVIDLFRQ